MRYDIYNIQTRALLAMDWPRLPAIAVEIWGYNGIKSGNILTVERGAGLPSDKFDWAKLGRELWQAAKDAHGTGMPSAEMAYLFLLDNPECFGDVDSEWPLDMPQEAPEALVEAYCQQAAEDEERAMSGEDK
jgi:hypothetical protein